MLRLSWDVASLASAVFVFSAISAEAKSVTYVYHDEGTPFLEFYIDGEKFEEVYESEFGLPMQQAINLEWRYGEGDIRDVVVSTWLNGAHTYNIRVFSLYNYGEPTSVPICDISFDGSRPDLNVIGNYFFDLLLKSGECALKTDFSR